MKSSRRGGTRPGSLLRQSIPIRGVWTAQGPTANWASVALSANGSSLVAAVNGGQIYLYPRFGSTSGYGPFVGSLGSAVELQYVGNGWFVPLSQEGSFAGF